MSLDRKIRYGMVGGGPGAFIGEVHRMAAVLDGKMELVAGSFSSKPEKSRQMGNKLHLDENRVYDSFEEMAREEAALPRDERIDCVSIVTPNFLHFPAAKAFIEQGIHVICDKPMTNTIDEAEELCRLVEKHQVVFGLTHNYTGYPMVKEAKKMVADGKLGELQKVVVEYPQGWLAQVGEEEDAWRLDPDKAGVSLSIGDVGSHAENLVEYITGQKLAELYADIHSFGEEYELEDDANMLVHYEDGLRGILYVSQMSVGEENDFNIRLYGDKASLEWHQETPGYLYVKYPDAPEEIYKAGNPYLSKTALGGTRLPPGHPEGFIEAFGNIYAEIADAIAAHITGEKSGSWDFPTVQDGARGVHFIHKAIESGNNRKWIDMDYTPPGS